MSMPVETIISKNGQSDDETLPDSAFYWREADGVKVLVCHELEAAGFMNGFSTRLGGVSPFPSGDLNLAGFNEDSRENIYENRRRFLRLFPNDMKIAAVWQVHGDAVKTIASEEDVIDSDDYADAMVSQMDGVLVGVKTADCVPVLIGDPSTRSFAAIHAGWRGTVREITKKAVERLVTEFSADPDSMIAAIGPAACGRNYEIGADVIEEFDARIAGSGKYFTPTRPGHALVDLHAANCDQLIAAGVRDSNIHTAPFCTMERPDLFFTYRLEKQKYGKTGRLLSVIGRAPLG